MAIEPRDVLPLDGGLLVGRYWCPVRGHGVPFRLEGDRAIDLESRTIAHLLRATDPAAEASNTTEVVHGLDELLSAIGDPGRAHLLAPVDLQPIKAAGVTFVESMLERVIEEATRGDAAMAAEARDRIMATIGDDVTSLRPGSPEAMAFCRAASRSPRDMSSGTWSSAFGSKSSIIDASCCRPAFAAHRAISWYESPRVFCSFLRIC